MKLREFQSVADEQLDKGRQIRSELEENRRTLEDMESEREARYDDMAAAMEVTLSPEEMERLTNEAGKTGIRQQGMWEPQ